MIQTRLGVVSDSADGYNINATLEEDVLYVVDAISKKDARGAWTTVICHRIANTTRYTTNDVKTTIIQMLWDEKLFVSLIDLWGGMFEMTFVKVGGKK